MKKFYLFVLMFVIAGIAFGQVRNQIVIKNDKAKSEVVNVKPNLFSPLKSAKTPTDTIFMNEFFEAGQAANMGYLGGGWVFGVNDAGSKECAQGFRIDMGGLTQYGIEEVLLWVAGVRKQSINGSDLQIKICAIDDSSHYGTSTTQYDISCPGTVLKTINFPWNNELDTLTSDWTYVLPAKLDEPLFVKNDYAVVLNFDDYYSKDDTIGFIVSAPGGASNFNGIEYTWWKYASTTDFWTLASDVFANMDRAIAVWPVVDRDFVGINENTFVDGVMLGQNTPNPANGSCQIQYKIKNAGNVKIEFYNSNGSLVKCINEGNKAAGLYSVTIDLSNLASGNYYYSLNSDNHRMTRKMVITK
jgi:hypothetical protein